MENLEFVLHDLNYVGDYKQYEEERQKNEEIRISNENERIIDETNRVNQEETRKLAEIEREKNIKAQLDSLKLTEEDFKERIEAGEFKGDKGDKGETGEKGEQGEQGEAGYTPIRGTDYWTEADIEAMKEYCDEFSGKLLIEMINEKLDKINGEVV